jgi:putative lipase involved disintegration of autophagic bodies
MIDDDDTFNKRLLYSACVLHGECLAAHVSTLIPSQCFDEPFICDKNANELHSQA